MYGVGQNTGLSLAPWRVLFLICGALTAAAGVGFYLLMPNGPGDAWFLSAKEKKVLSGRMVRDREGGDKTSFEVTQVKEALCDVRSWCIFAFGLLVTMQSPVLTVGFLFCRNNVHAKADGLRGENQFASLVIDNIGYSKFQTMLYTAPSGAVQIAMLWVGVAGCTVLPQNRTLVALAVVIPPLAGCVCLLKLHLDSGWGMIVASWFVRSSPLYRRATLLS